MIRITIKSLIQADLASVWFSVTSLNDCSWRRDIKTIEVSDDRHFKEISRDGYITNFTITVVEPFRRYSFIMDNENFFGEWTGCFRQIEKGTEIYFVESMKLKKWWLYPLSWFYVKLHQKRYIADLKRKCEWNE